MNEYEFDESEIDKPCCGNCCWSQINGSLWGLKLSCRRFPPVPVRELSGEGLTREWPTVREDDVCGEFSPNTSRNTG